MSIDPLEYLEAVGHLPDQDIDIAPSAICLAAVSGGQYKGRNFDRYFHHLKVIAEEVGQRYESLMEAGADDTPETQIAALKHVLADKFGYCGDEDDYDNGSVNNIFLETKSRTQWYGSGRYICRCC